jgi:hypothetical protein
MGLLGRFLHYSIDTYGGAPVLLVITLLQLALLGWVVVEVARALRERSDPSLSPDARRIRAVHRAELWQKSVRPLALTLMLLGPGIGLGMSTLLGALGMGSLGDVMGTSAGADQLAATMASAYREISYAYFLMMCGTSPAARAGDRARRPPAGRGRRRRAGRRPRGGPAPHPQVAARGHRGAGAAPRPTPRACTRSWPRRRQPSSAEPRRERRRGCSPAARDPRRVDRRRAGALPSLLPLRLQPRASALGWYPICSR